jgi:hypothetical protein
VEFKNACAVISRVSKKLVEEKYKEAENGELKNKDLLSLLINTNKILPDEEKMTYEELKNQAIKKIFIYLSTGRRDIVNIKFIPLKFGGNLSNFYSAPDFNEVSSFCGMLWKCCEIRQVSIIYTKVSIVETIPLRPVIYLCLFIYF